MKTSNSTRRQSSATARATASDTVKTPLEPSVKTAKLINGIRALVTAFFAQTTAWLGNREELYPAFGRAFKAFKEDTKGTLADFVRQFDPSVPLLVKEYKGHKAYQAADYLMRRVRDDDRIVRLKEQGKAGRPVTRAASPLDGMARLIKSMLPLVSADQVSKLWDLVEKELHWTERQRETLENRVKDAEPLLSVRAPRGSGGQIPQLRIAVPHGHAAGKGTEEESETAAA